MRKEIVFLPKIYTKQIFNNRNRSSCCTQKYNKSTTKLERKSFSADRINFGTLAIIYLKSVFIFLCYIAEQARQVWSFQTHKLKFDTKIKIQNSHIWQWRARWRAKDARLAWPLTNWPIWSCFFFFVYILVSVEC